jgi:ammonia channel protein AmtB
MATAVVSFQWFFWGYSLAFSHTAGKYIGDLENIGFRNVLAAPSVGSIKIPDLLFAVYQGMFAAITVALAVGAVAERGRMVRSPTNLPLLFPLEIFEAGSRCAFVRSFGVHCANFLISCPVSFSCSSGLL